MGAVNKQANGTSTSDPLQHPSSAPMDSSLCSFRYNDTHTPLSPHTSVLVYISAHGLPSAWKVLLCLFPIITEKNSLPSMSPQRAAPNHWLTQPDRQPLRLPLTHTDKLMVGDYLFTNNQTRSSSRTNHG